MRVNRKVEKRNLAGGQVRHVTWERFTAWFDTLNELDKLNFRHNIRSMAWFIQQAEKEEAEEEEPTKLLMMALFAREALAVLGVNTR